MPVGEATKTTTIITNRSRNEGIITVETKTEGGAHFLEVRGAFRSTHTILLGAPRGCRGYTRSPCWCRCQNPHTSGEPWTLQGVTKHWWVSLPQTGNISLPPPDFHNALSGGCAMRGISVVQLLRPTWTQGPRSNRVFACRKFKPSTLKGERLKTSTDVDLQRNVFFSPPVAQNKSMGNM